MPDSEFIQNLRTSIQAANNSQQPLHIQGGGSKQFYGNDITANPAAKPLDVSDNRGIIEYEPSELYITARNGTLISEVESILDTNQQMLPFEPAQFTRTSTLGGTVACGLSGPRRPYASAMRDCVLGVNIVNGNGEYLKFGGRVMKNVAGYDASRLMCGAFGTLGVITQVSLKVIPSPHAEMTLAMEVNASEALKMMHHWTQTQLPISATFFNDDILYVRLAGHEKTINKVHQRLGGEIVTSNKAFWEQIKNQQIDFFDSEQPLWRCIVPSNTPSNGIEGTLCMEWNGGLRWIKSQADSAIIMHQCRAAGGYATLFKSKHKTQDCLSEPNSALKQLHINLKNAFDPNHILNPGRMYSWC